MEPLSRYHRAAILRLLFLGLLAFTAVLYLPVLGHEFIDFDTTLAIVHNKRIHQGLTLQNLAWALGTTYYDYWHPLTWISHMVDIELYGLNPAGHHFTNVILHCVNVVALFILARTLGAGPQGAMIASALLALHPIHVESVAWVVERKDLLAALFWYGALLSYVQYSKKRSLIWYSAALASLVLSLMAKPMAITLPFLLVALDVWPLRRLPCPFVALGAGTNDSGAVSSRKAVRHAIVDKLPLLAVSLASASLTYRVVDSIGSINHSLPAAKRLANAIVSYTVYLKTLLWPHRLAILYPFPSDIPVFAVVASGLALVLITYVVLLVRRDRPYWLLGWLWYLICLSPVSGIVHTGFQSHANRFAYMPFAGIYISLGFELSRQLCWLNPKHRALTRLAFIVVAGLLALRTSTELSYWRDSISLFKRAVEVTDDNTVMLGNLGGVLRREGLLAESLGAYKKALKLAPMKASLHYGIGLTYMESGDTDRARRHLSISLQADSSNKQTQHAMGQLLARSGHHAAAIDHYRKALSIDSTYWQALSDLGTSLRSEGRLEEALRSFTRAMQVNPDATEPIASIGTILLEKGRPHQALMYLGRASDMAPTSSQYANNAGVACLRSGQAEYAVQFFNRAIAADPLSALGYRNRALAYREIGADDLARSDSLTAIKLQQNGG